MRISCPLALSSIGGFAIAQEELFDITLCAVSCCCCDVNINSGRHWSTVAIDCIELVYLVAGTYLLIRQKEECVDVIDVFPIGKFIVPFRSNHNNLY